MSPIEFCSKYRACSEGRQFATKFNSMAEVWDSCKRLDWLFWILRKHKPLKKEQSVCLAIKFAESCLKHVPETELRPKAAIDAAKKWLEDPSEENSDSARSTADCADAAASSDAYADAAARAARSASDAYSASLEKSNQCKIIRSFIANPFK